MTSFLLATRTQFTFATTDRGLACFFNSIVANSLGTNTVNIVGLFVTKVCNKKCNLVKLVAGNDDSADPTVPTTDTQNAQVRATLNQLGIKFTEQQVIQLFNVEVTSGTHGALRIPYTALFCADIPVNAVYVGEPAAGLGIVVSLFFEVPASQLAHALQVLGDIVFPAPPTPFDENTLCINRINVGTKCTGGRCGRNNCDPCKKSRKNRCPNSN